MKSQLLITIIITAGILSCAEKKHKRTRKLPDGNYYVEVFTANSFGLNQEYFTDSLTFRMFVGTVDEEHDYFHYTVDGDRLYITKIGTGNKNCRWVDTKNGLKTVLCDTEILIKKELNLAKIKNKR